MLRLATHFFQGFFRLSFLDDAGEESFKRVLIGILAGFVAFGLWLPRVYAAKYGLLHSRPTGDPYLLALAADELLIIAFPMFIVAFAMTLVCHSLFPNETDYRILMALPISRGAIFLAKLAALGAFASIFIVTTSVAMAVPFAAMSTSRWNPHYWPTRAAALTFVNIGGSIFAAAAIVAVQGLVTVLSPKALSRRVSVLTQTALICGLVLLLPFLFEIPAQAADLQSRPHSLYFMPPVWFLGLLQTILGSREPFANRLAQLAFLGTGAVLVLSAICYLVVYNRFDRVIVRAEKRGRVPFFANAGQKRHPTPFLPPEYAAVRLFTGATIRRSGLHQVVFLGVAAVGFSLAINKLIGAATASPRRFVEAVVMAPLIVMFAAILGLRSSLLLPVTPRAAWVFRLTEAEGRRPAELAFVEHAILFYGVCVPTAIGLPLQAGALGWRSTFVALPLTLAIGTLMTEASLMRWHRIPFTCTYMPGKRPVVHTVLLLLVTFVFSTNAGAAWVHSAVTDGHPMWPVVGCFLALAGLFRWLRIQVGHGRPLEFEDDSPEAIFGLELNS